MRQKSYTIFSICVLLIFSSCSHDGTYIGWDSNDSWGSLTIVVSGDKYIEEGDGYVNKGIIKDNKWLYDDCGVCIGHIDGNTIHAESLILKKQ